MTFSANILIVVTSHAVVAGTGQQTGLWIEELTTPYYIFRDAGATVDIVSIKGGAVPINPLSMTDAYNQAPSVARFLQDTVALQTIQDSRVITVAEAGAYDAVFLPGGHGTMWDLPGDDRLAALLSAMWDDGRAVAAVCHGPAGLLGARDADGKSLIAGRRVASFTNDEEEQAGVTAHVPFLLEDRLRALGGLFGCALPFQPYAVRDGRLITGQNPASCEDVARLTLDAVRDRQSGTPIDHHA